MLWLASCSNFTSINGIPMDSMLLVSIAFFCLIFFNNWIFSFKICATTFFTFSQPDILPSSCNRSYLIVITFSLRAGFTSGSPSLLLKSSLVIDLQIRQGNLVLWIISVIYLIWKHQDLLSCHLLDHMQLEDSATVQHLSDHEWTESCLWQRSWTFYLSCWYNQVLPLSQSKNTTYLFQYPTLLLTAKQF